MYYVLYNLEPTVVVLIEVWIRLLFLIIFTFYINIDMSLFLQSLDWFNNFDVPPLTTRHYIHQ